MVPEHPPLFLVVIGLHKEIFSRKLLKNLVSTIDSKGILNKTRFNNFKNGRSDKEFLDRSRLRRKNLLTKILKHHLFDPIRNTFKNVLLP